MNQEKSKLIHRWLCIIAIFNLIFAVGLVLVGSVGVQLSYATILSKYRVLDVRGVIDHSKLEDTWGESAARDWFVAVDCLIGDSLRGLMMAHYWIAAVFCINAICIWVIRSKHKQVNLLGKQ